MLCVCITESVFEFHLAFQMGKQEAYWIGHAGFLNLPEFPLVH